LDRGWGFWGVVVVGGACVVGFRLGVWGDGCVFVVLFDLGFWVFFCFFFFFFVFFFCFLFLVFFFRTSPGDLEAVGTTDVFG